MARPIAREAAMQLVFEQLFGGEATAETLVDLIDYNPGEKDSTYIDTVVSGAGRPRFRRAARRRNRGLPARLDARAPVPRGFGDYAPCRV